MALILESSLSPRRRMLTGVARYMQEHSHWAVYLKPPLVEKSLNQWLNHWEGDGIIAALNEQDAGIVLSKGVPVVDIVGVLKLEGVPLVHANDASIGKIAAEHLLERGFRTFGFVEYTEWAFSVERRRGFAAAVAAHGHSCEVLAISAPAAGRGGPDMWEQQQQSLMAWLTKFPKPVGIMAATDLLGQQILEACQRLEINVPESIAVIGADNDEPICMLSWPPLSSVIINDHQRGYEAAALLDRMMSGEKPPKKPVYIEPAGIVERASTEIMATTDEAVVAAMRFLREHATERIDVGDVVAEVPLSRSMLERRFRKVVGRSINDELVRLRLSRAIILLTQTDLELRVVAQRSGFNSQPYMNAVFRTKLGRTPGSYRAERPQDRD